MVLNDLVMVGPAPGGVFTPQEKEEETGTFMTHGNTCNFTCFELGNIRNKAMISILFEKLNIERKPVASQCFWSTSRQDPCCSLRTPLEVAGAGDKVPEAFLSPLLALLSASVQHCSARSLLSVQWELTPRDWRAVWRGAWRFSGVCARSFQVTPLASHTHRQ